MLDIEKIHQAASQGFDCAETLFRNIKVGNIKTGEVLDFELLRRCKQPSQKLFFAILYLLDALVNYSMSHNRTIKGT